MIKDNCSGYLKKAARVAFFCLQNSSWTGDSKDMQVLCKLADKILSDIKKTELGRLNMNYFTLLKGLYFKDDSSS